jgi:thiamine-phosphate pyrophosphorylase
MFDKLQYISQGATIDTQIENIQVALDAGCTWIQLRFKNGSEAEFIQAAEKARNICSAYNAIFIVNDHVRVAKEVDAHGVHLGLDDMPVQQAKTILGDDKIIGGTANTLMHALQRVEENCSYIGLGPFRFTATKEKLSPILGLQGYASIMHELSLRKIETHVFAIGGILKDDIENILKTGVYGVAVSGAVTNDKHPEIWIQNFKSITT